ncbi:hypothetical protein K8I28_12610 [bacterium]|nr:hypothetical protein [bacterium]
MLTPTPYLPVAPAGTMNTGSPENVSKNYYILEILENLLFFSLVNKTHTLLEKSLA